MIGCVIHPRMNTLVTTSRQNAAIRWVKFKHNKEFDENLPETGLQGDFGNLALLPVRLQNGSVKSL